MPNPRAAFSVFIVLICCLLVALAVALFKQEMNRPTPGITPDPRPIQTVRQDAP